MEYKQVDNKFIVRIDKGEEIVETLKKFCEKNEIKLGLITGIGAANKITVGLFETKTKKYHSKEFVGDYELAPLIGNVSTKDGEVYLHLHVNLSDSEHKSFGGHLNSAVVSATCEVIIDSINGTVDRSFSDEIGLNLYKF